MLPSDHGASHIYNESPSRTSSQQHHQSKTIRCRCNHYQVTPSGVLFLSSIQPFLHKFALSSVCLKLDFLIFYVTAVEPPWPPMGKWLPQSTYNQRRTLYKGKMGVQDMNQRQAQHSPEHYRRHRQRLAEKGTVNKDSTKDNIWGVMMKWTR